MLPDVAHTTSFVPSDDDAAPLVFIRTFCTSGTDGAGSGQIGPFEQRFSDFSETRKEACMESYMMGKSSPERPKISYICLVSWNRKTPWPTPVSSHSVRPTHPRIHQITVGLTCIDAARDIQAGISELSFNWYMVTSAIFLSPFSTPAQTRPTSL